MDIKQDLLNLKKEIDSAKREVAELEGREKQLINQLKDEFEIDNLSDAKDLLKTMEEELEEKEKLLNKKWLKLKNNFAW